jgi:transketolase
VGEDGPTHQPIEQLISLRAIPGLMVWRPGDANEVIETWKYVMKERHTPAVLVLSRQNLPTLDRMKYAPATGTQKGAYVVSEAPGGKPEALLLATGSELSLALQAQDQLTKEGIKARVVSMPCWEVFDEQDQEYRDSVIPPGVTARVAVEQASTVGWDRWVGSHGAVVGMRTFGASAPLKELQKKFGFTVDNVVTAVKTSLKKSGAPAK